MKTADINNIVIPNIGVTAEEAATALTKAMRLLPPLGETEIELIKRNPNLSKFQKWRLIHMIKKEARK